jgi:hypothetical protein
VCELDIFGFKSGQPHHDLVFDVCMCVVAAKAFIGVGLSVFVDVFWKGFQLLLA